MGGLRAFPPILHCQPWGCLLAMQVPGEPCQDQLGDPPRQASCSSGGGRAVLPFAFAPPNPRIRYTFLVKCVVLLIYRVFAAGGLAEEPYGKLHFAGADLSARSLQCVYLSERHTQPSLAALPNAVWRLGSEGQTLGRRK